MIVRNIHGINCPEWISIGETAKQFTAEGVPVEEKIVQRVQAIIHYFLKMVAHMREFKNQLI